MAPKDVIVITPWAAQQRLIQSMLYGKGGGVVGGEGEGGDGQYVEHDMFESGLGGGGGLATFGGGGGVSLN